MAQSRPERLELDHGCPPHYRIRRGVDGTSWPPAALSRSPLLDSPLVAARLLALLALAAALLTAPADAFTPGVDRPAADYGAATGQPGRASPTNQPARGSVATAAAGTGRLLTVQSCYAVAATPEIGRVWQQWSNLDTGEWVYLYAAPGGDTWSLYSYAAGGAPSLVADGLRPNELRALDAPLLVGAPAREALRLRAVMIGLGSGSAVCPGGPDDPVGLAISALWQPEGSRWRGRLLPQQAIETMPLGPGRTVFYDGWTPIGSNAPSVELQAPSGAPLVEDRPLLDRALDQGLARAPRLVQVAQAALAVALALPLAALLAFLTRRRWWPALRRVPSAFGSFLADMRSGAAALARERPTHLVSLALVVLIGVAVRIVHLDQPMRGDEAATFLTYGSSTFLRAATLYDSPNNHVLNTLLLHASALLFGDAPWALRLPALAAGTLLIPATYLAGRLLHGPVVGLWAAALVAGSSPLVEYATNARGYALVALAGTLALALAAYLRRLATLERTTPTPAAALLLAVVGAFGLYAVPTMLYSVAVALVWLSLARWPVLGLGRPSESPLPLGEGRGEGVPGARSRGSVQSCATALPRRADGGGHPRTPALAASAGAGALAIAALLYLPIVVLNGPSALLANEFVSSAGWSAFASGLGTMALGVAAQWTRDVPFPATLLMGLGLAASVAALPRGRGRPLPLAPVALIVVLCLLIIQRVLPPPRVWTWLVPFAAICVAAGWHLLASALLSLRAKRAASPSEAATSASTRTAASPAIAGTESRPGATIRAPLPSRARWGAVADGTAVLAAALLCAAVLLSGSVYASTETGVLPDGETIARDLGAMLEPGDRVLGGNPAEPILAYYFVHLRLPSAPLTQPVATARRVLIVANDSPSYRQSAPQVLRYHGLSGGWLTNLRELRRYPQATLYEAVNPG